MIADDPVEEQPPVMPEKFTMSIDPPIMGMLIASLLITRGVLHSDPQAVSSALHCSRARGLYGMGMHMLDQAEMLGDGEVLTKTVDTIVSAGSSWLMQVRPEWYAGPLPSVGNCDVKPLTTPLAPPKGSGAMN